MKCTVIAFSTIRFCSFKKSRSIAELFRPKSDATIISTGK